MSDNKRIIKNTGYLYIRMFIIMGVSLYTSRVVLDKLGANDYGLYNVVGGVVAMLGFLNGTLSIGTSRFLTFELGVGNHIKLNNTFVTTFFTHLVLSIIVMLVMETVGLWFFYNKLIIPENRLDVAFWVYQLSLLTTIVSITQVPYTSVMIAHEKMNLYAYVSVYEAVAKLLVVYLLSITPFDKMLIYAILVAAVQISVAMFYRFYCNCNFKECKLSFAFDIGIFKRIMGFSGWNIAANITEILKSQGVIILMNMFFQPAIVAAQAIGNQISSAMMQFVNNVRTAINPQIIKLYAVGDHEGSKRLTLKSAVYVFDLLLILGLPLILLMECVLDLWLKEVPSYAVIFAQFIVASQILGNFGNAFYLPMLASGKIKKNSIASVFIGFGHFSILYIIFKLGGGVMWVQYMGIISVLLFSYIIKPYILYKDVNYNFSEILNCYLNCFKVALVSCLISIPVKYYLTDNLISHLIVFAVSISSVAVSSLIFMDPKERGYAFAFIKRKIHSSSSK
ncbi:polysaccharide biosynthesis protein [uncultured Bacteroides sp.]|uniref:lipopolysaccharide biosynthesis protein n=1 Tax=uncultured Bacteroides sp. TaxID=162156 RepID=UPI0025DC06DC|nr:polysaccharide biosynthesis protein [uncultured Bacteroides sp.]